MSGQGEALTIGDSGMVASLKVGEGRVCQPISGQASMWAMAGPVQSVAPTLTVALTGLLCTPLEGTATAISGTYQVIGRGGYSASAGSGGFAGRAYANGQFVLFFKGTI
jgi:hypothetical protein